MAIDSRVAVGFQRKEHERTAWLVIEAPVDAPPTELIRALTEIGWRESEVSPLPPMPKTSWQYDAKGFPMKEIDHGYMVQEHEIGGPKGSALFGGWTEEEAKQNLAAARKVLKKFGFTNIPMQKLTLQDLL